MPSLVKSSRLQRRDDENKFLLRLAKARRLSNVEFTVVHSRLVSVLSSFAAAMIPRFFHAVTCFHVHFVVLPLSTSPYDTFRDTFLR